jgi:hypothetical protein
MMQSEPVADRKTYAILLQTSGRVKYLTTTERKSQQKGKKGVCHCECGEPVTAVIGGKDGPHPSVGKLGVRSV